MTQAIGSQMMSLCAVDDGHGDTGFRFPFQEYSSFDLSFLALLLFLLFGMITFTLHHCILEK